MRVRLPAIPSGESVMRTSCHRVVIVRQCVGACAPCGLLSTCSLQGIFEINDIISATSLMDEEMVVVTMLLLLWRRLAVTSTFSL